MATPAQIRRDRKNVLRTVKQSLRLLDTELEKLERTINRVLKVRKRFPDEDDAIIIADGLRIMDKQLDQVVKQAEMFGKIVKAF